MHIETNTARVGVIGLGLMGSAFAKHLAAAGVETLGFDVLADKRDALKAAGGHSRSSPVAVAKEADVVITSLPSVQALEQALFGTDGLIGAARPGLIVVETSTFPLDAKVGARDRLAAAGVAMLDAPVSGTSIQAEAKDITVLASGDRADFDRVRDLLSHFSRSVRYVGEFGAGSKVKYIANLLVAIHTMAAAEALMLGEKAGLDRAALLDVLKDGAGTSRMLEVRGPSMVAETYAAPMMKIDVFLKDLKIIGEFARECESPVPLFDASAPLFHAAHALGMGGYDMAAVIAVLRQQAAASGR